jgi:two-component system phosphate regulon sensor histidine kinase PhoR
VSLARSSGQGGRISPILAFVFPAIIGATLALAYYGYQGAQDVVSWGQRQFQSVASAQVAELLDGVQLEMNAKVNGFLEELITNLDDARIGDADKCDIAPAPPVESFAVFMGGRRIPGCAGPSTKLSKKARDALIHEADAHDRLFEWNKLPAGNLKYVHDGEKGMLFVGVKLRAADERMHFVVLRLDAEYIRGRVLDVPLRRLGQNNRVALVDERGATFSGSVFGGGEPRPTERFLYNAPFGRAFYNWSLRVAPREEGIRELEEQLERQKVLRPLLVIFSTVIIAVGLGIVLLAVMAERRASRLKSDFIANVSHELKTPLSLIRMFGEMVATGRHKGEVAAREYGGIITRESERLSHLIDNVLDFARLERGKASYDFAEGDLAVLLERALDVCRYRLDKERIRLRTEVEPRLPLVRMDENALTLLILNLVDNALKYAAEGGAVEVALSRMPGGVVLSVRDHGPGIPREEHGRVFERFYRAQSARDRNVRGSGIGLSLVRHIAEAHGGRVTVESPVLTGRAPGPGAVFRVFLPAPIVEGSESAERHAVGGAAPSALPHPGPVEP